MDTILTQAIELLGQPVKPDDGRGWAHWWCPFHPDSNREGRGGTPNFGINIASDHGYWKCLRCGVRGSSMAVLRQKLPNARPQNFTAPSIHPKPSLTSLDEALAETRTSVMQSPAWNYIQSRGIRPITSLTYGLGYGVPRPSVSSATFHLARKARLVSHEGTWIWAEGVVYADPPTEPRTIQVRHLRQGENRKYQTWGKLEVPLGAWRIKPKQHQILLVVEGMFDMLALAQAIHDRALPNILPLYTGGASPSSAMLNWFERHPEFAYLLIPDNDEAGENWSFALLRSIQKSGGLAHVAHPPHSLDPDEAISQGWWPEGLS